MGFVGNTKLEQIRLVSRFFAAIPVAVSARLSGIVMLLTMMVPVAAGADYFPGQNWQSKSPAAAGFVPEKLAAAIALAKAYETCLPEQLAKYLDVRDSPVPGRISFLWMQLMISWCCAGSTIRRWIRCCRLSPGL